MNSINQINNDIITVLKSEVSFRDLIDGTEIIGGMAIGEPLSALKFLSKCIEVGGNITNLLFYNKLQDFLNNVSEIPYEKRIKFITEHVNGKEQEFSKRLIEEIDSINDGKKIYFISNLFKALMDERIDENKFYRLVHIIRSAMYEDLIYMKNNINRKEIVTSTSVLALNNLGLMYQSVIDANNPGKYNFLDLAKEVVKYALVWGEEKSIDCYCSETDNDQLNTTTVLGAQVVFG